MVPSPPSLSKPFEFLAPMRVYAVPHKNVGFRLVKSGEDVEQLIGVFSTWQECFVVGRKVALREEQSELDIGVNAWLSHRSNS
jgi:hypothetical protein